MQLRTTVSLVMQQSRQTNDPTNQDKNKPVINP